MTEKPEGVPIRVTQMTPEVENLVDDILEILAPGARVSPGLLELIEEEANRTGVSLPPISSLIELIEVKARLRGITLTAYDKEMLRITYRGFPDARQRRYAKSVSTNVTVYKDAVTPSIRSLAEMIDASSVDEKTKQRLQKELKEYEEIAETATTGALERQKAQFELDLYQQRRSFEQDQEIRLAETKTQRIVRLLDKDLVSVIIGGVLLIIIGVALIWMIAIGLVEARLIESAFLILLGFFFGQGVSRSSGVASPKAKAED